MRHPKLYDQCTLCWGVELSDAAAPMFNRAPTGGGEGGGLEEADAKIDV